MELKIGSVVFLRGSLQGPAMTVTDLIGLDSETVARCAWFNIDDEMETQDLPLDALCVVG